MKQMGLLFILTIYSALITKAQTEYVLLYTTSGNPDCIKVVKYFNSNKIKFYEYPDIFEGNTAKGMEFVKNSGKYQEGTQVNGPIICFNNQVDFNIGNIDLYLSEFKKTYFETVKGIQVAEAESKKSKSKNKDTDKPKIYRLSEPLTLLAKTNEITVFTKTGCSRSTSAVNYLKQNNIPFSEYNLDYGSHSNYMYTLLATDKSFNPQGVITTPVMVYNTQLYYNTPDLGSQMRVIHDAYNKANGKQANILESLQNTEVLVSPSEIVQAVERHNFYRQQVGTAPLVWSHQLAQKSQQYADTLAARNKNIPHSLNSDDGENLYMSNGQSTIVDAIDAWASEISLFKYEPYTGKRGDGHYTQIIWETTTQVGCAYARNGKNIYIVCKYSPAGNETDKYPYPK